MPAPWPVNGLQPQGCFSVASNDPSLTFPGSSSGTDNFWVDVQVGDYSDAPSGTSLRLFPNMPAPFNINDGDNTLETTATAFSLSQACSLNKIWLYSPSGAAALPTRTVIWNTSTQAEVPGTDNNSPLWKVPGGGAGPRRRVDIRRLQQRRYRPARRRLRRVVLQRQRRGGLRLGAQHVLRRHRPGRLQTVGGPAWNGISWGGGILAAPNVANGPELVYDDGSGTHPGNGMYRPTGLDTPPTSSRHLTGANGEGSTSKSPRPAAEAAGAADSPRPSTPGLHSSSPKPQSTGHLSPIPACLYEKVPSDLG